MAQEDFALVEIPTGLGKTEAVVASWLWRLQRPDMHSPRRLIYSLPMRSLVEQTAARIGAMLKRMREARMGPPPSLRVVMGGDIGDEWFEQPEHPTVIIGTQDLLLSRALNRGYAMSRFQWPMAFGAINNDVLWVIDEVQLHGIGAVTAAQLQGLREKLGTAGLARTMFISATMDRTWIDTVDHPLSGRVALTLGPEDLAFERVNRIVNAPKTVRRLEASDETSVASAVVKSHRPGTLTLVVLNTVDRARGVYRAIERLGVAAALALMHSRFRPNDRNKHLADLLAPIDSNGSGRIVVATQVVEAGIDIDAAVLVTDLAPWSSMVQRLGRCNRRGLRDDAVCYWIDSGEPTEKSALPYYVSDIQAARKELSAIDGKCGSPARLPKLPISLESGLVLRRVDLLDLFDTSPDLSGHDVDVSRFIRDADDITATVFWREEPPMDDDPPRREELCPAPLSDLRKLLKKLAERGEQGSARIVNQFGASESDGGPRVWVPIDGRGLRPGLQVWLRSNVGWYDATLGFGEQNQPVIPIVIQKHIRGFEDECATNEGDRGTRIGAAVTLSQHALDTAEDARSLARELADVLSDGDVQSLVRAALWHDVGKAHPVFQETMIEANGAEPPSREFWAKCIKRGHHKRPGFRHELPSLLAFLKAHGDDLDADLTSFLIAAHHGKLRMVAQPLPSDFGTTTRRLLGSEDGETVPAVRLGDAEVSSEFQIDLAAFQVGSFGGGVTWIDRVTGLRDNPNYGPFRLAYLELILRIADWRASKRATASIPSPA